VAAIDDCLEPHSPCVWWFIAVADRAKLDPLCGPLRFNFPINSLRPRTRRSPALRSIAMSSDERQSTDSQLALKACVPVLRWCSKNWIVIGFTLTFFLFTYFGIILYRTQLGEEIVVLTAARGTSSWRSGGRVAHRISQHERFPGVPFTARVEITDGAEEIKDRIQSDSRGNVIGYFLNQTMTPDNIRVLLPLDYDYLHILFRVDRLLEESVTTFHNELSEVSELIRPGKVFAGPPGSDSRALFDQIFPLYWHNKDDDPEDYLNPAIDDWLQARSALKQGQLDAIFFLTPFESRTMIDIARDQTSVLLGINDVSAALSDSEGTALLDETFPESSYYAGNVTIDDASAFTRVTFCPKGLATVAVRRVMVCSEAMRKSDAYQIAAAVRSALKEDSPQIGESDVPPLGKDTLPAHYKLMEPHDGALLHRDDKPPQRFTSVSSWHPAWLSSLAGLAPVVFGFVAKLIGTIKPDVVRELMERKSGATDTAPTTMSRFDCLRLEFEKALLRLEHQSGPLSFDEWNKRLAQLRESHELIRDYRNTGELTCSEAESLSQAIRSIRVELTFLEPSKEPV
jgi:TRAP-type uncharacterized transport system substrate-binding protein